MRTFAFKAAPGAETPIKVAANYLRVRAAGADLTLRVLADGSEQEWTFILSPGDDFKLDDGRFKTIFVSHAEITEQSVELLIGSGVKVSSAKFTGIVQLSGSVNLGLPTQGAGSQSTKTVTTTAQQIIGSNIARKYLLIQNKDTTGTVWINFSATATQANGIEIPPRSEREWDCNIVTGAVSAIGDLATQSNVIVLEA